MLVVQPQPRYDQHYLGVPITPDTTIHNTSIIAIRRLQQRAKHWLSRTATCAVPIAERPRRFGDLIYFRLQIRSFGWALVFFEAVGLTMRNLQFSA